MMTSTEKYDWIFVCVGFIVITLMQFAGGQGEEQSCQVLDWKKDRNPEFLCEFTVNMKLSDENCSVQFIETMVFPFTTNGEIRREIALLTKFQEIVNESVISDNESVDFNVSFGKAENNKKLLTMFTPESRKAVTFKLSYVMKNAVMKADRACSGVKADKDSAVIRWRSPNEWNFPYSYNILKVNFTFSNGTSKSVYSEEDIFSMTEVYKKLNDSKKACKSLECFPNNTQRDLKIFGGIAGSALVFGLIVYYLWGIVGRRNSSSGAIGIAVDDRVPSKA